MSESPKPIQPQIKTYNFQHIGECVDGRYSVRARGQTFNGGWVEFVQCAPFTPEALSDAIRMHAARMVPNLQAPKADHFILALHNALIAAAASAGEVIDPDTVLVEMFA